MKVKKIHIILTLIFIVILLGGWWFFIFPSTTAPGCYNKYSPFVGGCFGKNLIRNFKIEPNLPNCLEIRPHTCQGARLEVYNQCDTDVIIDEIKMDEMYNYLLFTKSGNGTIVGFKGNIDVYPYPAEDENIVVNGKIGDVNFNISYVITKALC